VVDRFRRAAAAGRRRRFRGLVDDRLGRDAHAGRGQDGLRGPGSGVESDREDGPPELQHVPADSDPARVVGLIRGRLRRTDQAAQVQTDRLGLRRLLALDTVATGPVGRHHLHDRRSRGAGGRLRGAGLVLGLVLDRGKQGGRQSEAQVHGAALRPRAHDGPSRVDHGVGRHLAVIRLGALLGVNYGAPHNGPRPAYFQQSGHAGRVRL